MQHKLLINGELVSGEGEKQPVYNPATGDVLLEIAEASAETGGCYRRKWSGFCRTGVP